MFHLLLAPVLLTASLSSIAPSVPIAQAQDVQVVLRIPAFDQGGQDRLTREAARNASVAIEYACLWSGVVVLKYTEVAIADRADAITFTRRLLEAAGIRQTPEFLHVHLEPRGGGKC